LDHHENQLRAAIERHYSRLERQFGRLVSDSNTAQDLTQEVFVRLWEALQSDREIQDLDHFIQGIARHVFHGYLRRKPPPEYPASEDWDYPDIQGLAPEQIAAHQDLSGALYRLVQRLERDDQWIVIGRYFFGMTGHELAESLGMPRRTVVSRHDRALKLLHQWARNKGFKF
jgi:RNA polymerase sigma-70 factor (ECF subfamily)